jgi:DNA-binding CsgD family transcriptional regulator
MADQEVNWTFGDPPSDPVEASDLDPASTPEGAAVVSLGILTVGLGLSVFVAVNNLLAAVAEGLGPHPVRRVAIGAVLLAISLALLAGRRRLMRRLHEAPWTVLTLAVIQLGVAAVEDLPEGPYFSSLLVPVGLAVIAGRPKLVWACALLVDACYAIVVFVFSSPASLSRTTGLGTVLGSLAAPLIIAVALEGLVRLYGTWSERIVMRSLPEQSATAPSEPAPLLLNPEPTEPAPWEVLSDNEISVMREMPKYETSSEIGNASHLAKTTVDHLFESARRKTGARTRDQLAALMAHPWFTGDVDEH